MNALEQEALVLRQVLALRRQGLAHDRALGMTLGGLPPGPMRSRVEEALQRLQAPDPGGPEPSMDVLVEGQARLERIEAAAHMTEARMWSRLSLSTGRWLLALGLVVPLTLAWLLSFADLEPIYGGASLPQPTALLLQALHGFRWGGPVLLVGVGLTAWRFLPSLAPGYGCFHKAASLLASRGANADTSLSPMERHYLEVRSGQVGAEAAGGELAQALIQEGQERMILGHQLLPVVGASLLAACIVLMLGSWMLPLFSLASS